MKVIFFTIIYCIFNLSSFFQRTIKIKDIDFGADVNLWKAADKEKANNPLKMILLTDWRNAFTIKFKNTSEKTVDAFEIITYTTDTWGNPQNLYYSSSEVAQFTPYSHFDIKITNIAPHTYSDESFGSSLNNYKNENATKTDYRMLRIPFTDKTVWNAYKINQK